MKEKTLKNPFSITLLALSFLLPLAIFPYIINPLANSKLFLAFLTAFISIFAFIFLAYKKKKWAITVNPVSISILVFAAFILISSLVSHQYPVKQLLGMGGLYLSFASIVLLAPNLIKENISKKFVIALNIAAVFLSIFTIFQVLGLGLATVINSISILQFPNSLAFSLTGSTFISIQFLSVVLISNLFDKKNLTKIQKTISLVLISIALAINIWGIIPGNEASFRTLSLSASSSVMKESLGVTKTALFGYGPDSFGNAYSILKPVWINGQDYWQFIFDSAFNLPMTLIVSAGLLAFLSWLFFIWRTIVMISKKHLEAKNLRAIIIATIIWQFFAPANAVMISLLAITLAIFIAANLDRYKEVSINLDKFFGPFKFKQEKKAEGILFTVIAILISVATGFLFFNFFKAYISYNHMYKANIAAQNNEISESYEHQKKARALSGHLDSIRRTYSLVNLEIAIALSNKTELNAAEQEQVLQLVNQAIREAKSATILDPQNYQNWLIVAEVYLQLIETTPQAQQEAFDALANAIKYNPNNPDLRMKLGQFFFSLQKYPEAITFFSQAVERKPDLARAYYALAKSFQANQQFEDAENALIKTLTLLTPESEDYLKVENELNQLSNQIEDERMDNQAPAEEYIPTPSEDELELSAEDNEEEQGSNLSELLDQEATEQVIQEEALTSEQEIIEN